MSKPTTEPGQASQSFQTRLAEPITRYFKDTRGELRKVTWPTRKQATNLTLIVLGVMVAMAVFLGTFDFIFATLVRLLVS